MRLSEEGGREGKRRYAQLVGAKKKKKSERVGFTLSPRLRPTRGRLLLGSCCPFVTTRPSELVCLISHDCSSDRLFI